MRLGSPIRAVLAAAPIVLAGCGGDGERPAARTCEPKSVSVELGTDGSPIPLTLPAKDHAVSTAIADAFCSPTWVVSNPDGTKQTY